MLNGTELLDRLKKSKVGQAIEREAEAETEAVRVKLTTEIEEAERKRDEKLPPLVADLSKVNAKVAKLEKGLEAARAEQRAAARAVRDCRWAAENRIARNENLLRASADPRIDEFQRELRATLERERRTGPDYIDQMHPITRYMSRRTNLKSFSARLEALQAAYSQAEELKLLTGADIEAEISKIRSKIPELGPIDETVAPIPAALAG